MNRPLFVSFALALLSTAPAQDEKFTRLTLRAIATRPNGDVVIDRGERDLLVAGDQVVLLPRNGTVLHGSVQTVQDRDAVVRLVDRNANVAPGTKGEVLVPRSRRKQAAPRDPEQPGDPAEPRPKRPEPRHEDEWRPGMPLLAGRRPPRPEDRSVRFRGRTYAATDLVHTLDTTTHSFARVGVDVEAENLAGHGGTLRFWGDLVEWTETSEQTGADLQVYELSYTLGGTRFRPDRWELGRFLPRDMPEFGLLDGIAWSHRAEDGLRFGASIGYLPELDEDLESFADLQLAAWVLGANSPAERLTWGIGAQKTWHRGKDDRDLLVAKVRRVEPGGWDLAATTWVDFYLGNDQKDGVGLSRARAHAARRWNDGSGLVFAYDHEEYPDQLRRELPQALQPATVLDAHQDRLSLHTYTTSEAGTRWTARASGYADEQSGGGSLELGGSVADLLQRDAHTGLTMFGVHGASSSLFGLRFDHGGPLAGGRFDLLGEVSFVHHEGFPNDRDELLQYRLGSLWTAALADRWSLSLHGDATLWDDEFSLAAGFYLQHTF